MFFLIHYILLRCIQILHIWCRNQGPIIVFTVIRKIRYEKHVVVISETFAHTPIRSYTKIIFIIIGSDSSKICLSVNILHIFVSCINIVITFENDCAFLFFNEYYLRFYILDSCLIIDMNKILIGGIFVDNFSMRASISRERRLFFIHIQSIVIIHCSPIFSPLFRSIFCFCNDIGILNFVFVVCIGDHFCQIIIGCFLLNLRVDIWWRLRNDVWIVWSRVVSIATIVGAFIFSVWTTR